MTWLKLDDSIASHTKVLRAGPEAAWLWVCCIAYATRHLTDGFVPSEALVTLGNFRNLSAALAKAKEVRLLQDRDGGVAVHHYLEHNPSAEQVRARVAEMAELARRGGKASAAKRSGQPARSSAPVEPARSSATLNVDPLPSAPLHSGGDRAPAFEEPTRSLGGRIARLHRSLLDAKGIKGVEDMSGAGCCESILAPLSWEDVVRVITAYVNDRDPFLVKNGWALRWLDAARVNKYLTPVSTPDDDWDKPQGPKGRNYDERDEVTRQ